MGLIIAGSTIFCFALRGMLNKGESDNYLFVLVAALGLSLALRGVAVLSVFFASESKRR